MEEVPIVTAYKLTDGSTTTRFPMGKTLDDAQPVVETVPGWHCDITGVRRFEDLPPAAQNYVTRLEELVGCKIKYISVGPEARCLHRAGIIFLLGPLPEEARTYNQPKRQTLTRSVFF